MGEKKKKRNTALKKKVIPTYTPYGEFTDYITYPCKLTNKRKQKAIYHNSAIVLSYEEPPAFLVVCHG